MNSVLQRRFERWFRHPDVSHDVLRPGDRAIACRNLRRALSWFEIVPTRQPLDAEDRDLYDDSLSGAVRDFQARYNHRVKDGLVGPGTRRLLVSELLHRFDASIFERLDPPEDWVSPSVFLSYSSADVLVVERLQVWLVKRGVRVVRDREFFAAGGSIKENIAIALSNADAVVAVFSENSRSSDWAALERSMAEAVESELGRRLLIYVRIDHSALPANDATRIAIDAVGIPLVEVGERLLHAITNSAIALPDIDPREDEPLAPAG